MRWKWGNAETCVLRDAQDGKRASTERHEPGKAWVHRRPQVAAMTEATARTPFPASPTFLLDVRRFCRDLPAHYEFGE